MVLLLLFTVSVTIYSIVLPIITYFRDPKGLRKYPHLSLGSGVTNIPFIIEAHKGFRSHTLLKAHKDHPVVRIGPNSLSFNDPAAIKDIYGHGTTCIKDRFYTELAGTHRHLADVVDKPEHARKRKTLSSAYAIKNLETWEYKVADMTQKLINAFDALCTQPLEAGQIPSPEDLTVDYRKWTNLFTISAIANIGLSEDIGFLVRGDDEIVSERMDGTKKNVSFRECLGATAWATTNLVWAYDWYKLLVAATKVISSTYREKWRLNKDWDGIVLNRVTTRLKRYQAGEKLDDFFTSLMEDKAGNPNNLEFGELVAEISIMMNAGSDTTAVAISNTMWLLLSNPGCMAKLRAEVDAALDDDEEKDDVVVVAPYDKVRHLPYLRACIDESLRILPPATFGLPRRTPPEGTYIMGEWVPGDTSVSMSAYVVHHNPAIYHAHDRFLPERWLGEIGKELQPYFIPFSTGARGCIGRNISYLEQTVLLASLVHRFEFALPYPGWEPKRFETTTLGSGSMPMKIWRRSHVTS